MKPLRNYLGSKKTSRRNIVRQLATISDEKRQHPFEAILRGAVGVLWVWECLYTPKQIKRRVRRSMDEREMKKIFYQTNTPQAGMCLSEFINLYYFYL